MIKKIAWEAFKNTGNIDTFMEFKQIEEIEKGIELSEKQKILGIIEGEQNSKTQQNL